jgi:hypothetical protein
MNALIWNLSIFYVLFLLLSSIPYFQQLNPLFPCLFSSTKFCISLLYPYTFSSYQEHPCIKAQTSPNSYFMKNQPLYKWMIYESQCQYSVYYFFAIIVYLQGHWLLSIYHIWCSLVSQSWSLKSLLHACWLFK